MRTQFDPTYNGSQGEINNEPSETVPDLSLTVRQLLTNHSRGIHSDVAENKGEYFDQEIPQFYDITDRINYKNQLLERLDELNETVEEEKTIIKAAKAAKVPNRGQTSILDPEQAEIPPKTSTDE